MRIVDILNEWEPRAYPLVEVCALAEARIVELVDEVVKSRVQAFAASRGLRYRPADARSFYLDGKLFEVRVTEHLTNSAIVQVAVVAVLDAAIAATQRPPVRVRFDGNGRYSTVMLYIDESLAQAEDRLARDLQRHFRAGYRWLEAHVLGELLAIEYRAAIELYMEVRSVLTPALADLVGLYAVRDSEAFYLLDPHAIQSALSRTISSRSNVEASPIEITALLVTQILDPKDTVSNASLRENRALDLRLEESRYAATGLQVAEGMFYGTNSVVSQPLVREGRIGVAAVYPVSVGHEVHHHLARIAPRCTEVLRNHRTFAADRIYGQSGSRASERWSPEMWAEIAGRFTGGFTNSQF